LEYTLVVSDMDGTLLRDDKTISPRTLTAIHRFQEAGGRFTIATGRNVGGVEPHVQAMGLTTPILLLNGCLGYDRSTDTDVFCHVMERPALDAVWPHLVANNLNIIVHGRRRGLTRVHNEVIAEHLRHDGISFDYIPDLSPATAGEAVKVLTIGEPWQLDRAEEAIEQADIPVVLVRSHPLYLEVLPQGGGKGTGLHSLTEHLCIPHSKTLTLGDWLNDLDLLAAAGLSVAMANGHPTLKKAAHRWTASNMDDGVAQVLEALVEGRPVGEPNGMTSEK